jgi:biopolymer transport protein ExbB
MSRSTCLLLIVFALSAVLTITRSSRLTAAEGEVPAAAAGQPDSAPPATETQSPVGWVLRSSGVIGLFILLLSIYFVATVIRLFVELRMDVAMPPHLVQRCDELIEQRDFSAVYNAVRDDDSFLARALSTGLAELHNGLAEARDVMERAGEVEMVEMEKRISMLAVLGTLGPMIGLIGTLKGMISSFSVIALSGVQLKPAQVAGGISEALILTFEGVALSVPAIYFFAVFRNRVSSISAATMLQADRTLRRFAHAARAKAPPAPAAPPPK